MDFISSVPHLPEIEARMLEWGMPWLLITGNISCSKDGSCYVDGRSARKSYQQVVAVIDAWQLRGGGVTILRSDDHISKWVQLMCSKLQKMDEEPVKLAQRAKQSLARWDKDDPVERAVYTLETFPGIGNKTAREIVKKFGTLGRSLVFLSGGGEDKVNGVGKKTLDDAKKWIGERLEIRSKQ